jgi:hypothetical protein
MSLQNQGHSSCIVVFSFNSMNYRQICYIDRLKWAEIKQTGDEIYIATLPLL